jgi:hypothetical protein
VLGVRIFREAVISFVFESDGRMASQVLAIRLVVSAVLSPTELTDQSTFLPRVLRWNQSNGIPQLEVIDVELSACFNLAPRLPGELHPTP